jgi:hypothetical protein
MSEGEHDSARSAGVGGAALTIRAARSVAEAKAGEVIMLGRGGEVLGPRQVTRARVRAWAVLGGWVAAVSVGYGVILSPLAGVAVAVGAAALVGLQLRHWPQYRAAVVLATTDRWEEAHAAMSALEAKRLPRFFKSQLTVTLSALDSLLGRPEEALRRLETNLPRLRRHMNAYAKVNRWRAEILRAGVLARLGRLGEARAQRDAVAGDIAAWEARRRRPRGDYFEMLLQGVNLEIAFEADAPDDLPDDDVLHQWARAALQRTRFGSHLVYLSWAFQRRGDEAMARHLLAEAPSRMVRSPLPAAVPRLHAWFEERRAAWGAGGGAGAVG